MTVNERLVVARLMDAFDCAARKKDRAQMLELLKQVNVANPEFTVDAILENPSFYGY